jgi:hypothetical protein
VATNIKMTHPSNMLFSISLQNHQSMRYECLETLTYDLS